MIGCLRSLLLILLLLLLGWAGWRWGDRIFPGIEERVREVAGDVFGSGAAEDPEEGRITPALADSAQRRIESFLEGEGADTLRLSGLEVTSILRYGMHGLLPSGLADPRVRIEGGRLLLEARAALGNFPELPDLAGIREILPDTVPLQVDGWIVDFGPLGRPSLQVSGIEAAGIPVPSRLHPGILSALGREAEEGLPPDAVVVPLPVRVRSLHLDAATAILTRGR